ncbi:hypothetical protein AVEN_87570-1 [Araneus ventricosus]|uniref:Reverse transcriptase domain-containing protein n=1 Tax=Araneus ventricosus TaxID=182803 RepID=A0A4Y2UJW6_ARAVE|nr:hypothetical protein AVEN_57248-1 [Araneus ventricosus]GBO37351.1 hypothetical protein AVEN_87570-1 [Araneus ventricosus]
MFQAAKSFIKEDLLLVVEEIGETLPTKATISKLKDIILKSKEYSEYPDFVASVLITAVADKKQKDDEKKRQEEERKLQHELELERLQFQTVTSDQSETQAIIEEVPVDEVNLSGNYLPHRPVLKESSTTPIRPVFDACARMQGHPSLNESLHSGPNLIELIPDILLRFREKKIGVTVDIRKAFLQISICKEEIS